MKSDVLLFDRPEQLQATVTPEDRALPRDGVRLLVATPDGMEHVRFSDLNEFLLPGDLLVVNESATLPASLPALGSVGPFILNLSTDYGNGLWLTEPRWSTHTPGPMPLDEGEEIRLPGMTAALVSSYPGLKRLWFVQMKGDVEATLAQHGSPIRYGYVDRDYPLDAYQTVFGRVPGSAEMPSAARPFTGELVDRLKSGGVGIAPVLLHTGVSSLEVESEDLEDQVMYAEPFAVPPDTAAAVNAARGSGRRVIAVGTTVVRALESAWAGDEIRPASGFTRLYIRPGSAVHAVDGLLTGFHDPMASHLAMLYALAGEQMVRASYAEAVRARYLWHEFGDSNLLLPHRRRD